MQQAGQLAASELIGLIMYMESDTAGNDRQRLSDFIGIVGVGMCNRGGMSTDN